MTVLPNAPIDPATGLPTPTIAVATNGGVSVIKDDGSVVDMTRSGYHADFVEFIEYNGIKLLCYLDNGGGVEIYSPGVFEIPNSDVDFGNVVLQRFTRDLAPIGLAALDGVPTSVSNSNIDKGNSSGLTRTYLQGTNFNSQGESSVAYIASDYNTGWMHGNVKGAFLSDTTAESLIANTNLASNFVFSATSRLTSHTYTDGALSWQMVDNAATDNGYVSIQLNGLTVGQSYIISVTLDNNAVLDTSDPGFDHRISHSDSTTTIFGHWDKTNASSETLTGNFIAKSANGDVFLLYVNAITLNVSNFIVRAVDDEDRSVNNKGLQVFGTITKSAVAGSGATAAELVAYSGWSSSNYLRQPYNSDLDFGTGDWCYMFWFNPNDAESGDVIFSRWSYNVDSSSAPRIMAYFNSGKLRFDVSDSAAGANYQGIAGTSDVQDTSTWHLGCILRRGNTAELWVDGRLENSAALVSGTSTGSYSDSNSILEIGYSPNAGSAEPGLQLSLLRASASAPSPEQIKKIYEDEKVLFQENSACTLYGSSDAVTALAYDDDNQVLHVGTSSGRSDFQGLRRINNTTTAVTTAISASNGLIAEQ